MHDKSKLTLACNAYNKKQHFDYFRQSAEKI